VRLAEVSKARDILAGFFRNECVQHARKHEANVLLRIGPR
jgi:hypothetical protein